MPKVPFVEAFLFWLKLGFISFGGPAGQIAIMHEYLVEKKKWISESKFLHALNYCMLLPGPEAQQLATYTGWLMHGTPGGIMAGLLFILPSVFILLALSIGYVTYGHTQIVMAIFLGIKPAVVAIVFLALLKIAEKALKKQIDYVFAITSLAALLFFKVPYPVVIVGAIVLGFVYVRFFQNPAHKTDKISTEKSEEEGFLIHAGSAVKPVNRMNLFLTLLVFAALWISPFFILNTFPHFIFFKDLSLFFTQAALVTFGGAYSVLLYVGQVAVEQFHWLTQAQMVDGLALGETTPGPLIMVLAFVGFMGGYNHFGGDILAGSVALGLTVYYTFLPSFTFILLGAPLVERTQQNKLVKQILEFVTAAVVGVIANLFLYMAGSVYVPPVHDSINGNELFSVTWIFISVLALKTFKVNMVLWIAISALAGYVFNSLPF